MNTWQDIIARTYPPLLPSSPSSQPALKYREYTLSSKSLFQKDLKLTAHGSTLGIYTSRSCHPRVDLVQHTGRQVPAKSNSFRESSLWQFASASASQDANEIYLAEGLESLHFCGCVFTNEGRACGMPDLQSLTTRSNSQSSSNVEMKRTMRQFSLEGKWTHQRRATGESPEDPLCSWHSDSMASLRNPPATGQWPTV